MKQYLLIIRNLHKVAGHKRRLELLLFGSCVVYNLAGLLPPIATAGIIKMITDKTFSGVWLYAGLYVVFYALYYIFLRLNYYAYMKIGEFYHISLQTRMFSNVAENSGVMEKVPRGRMIDTFADDVRWIVDASNVSTEIIVQAARLLIIFVIFLSQDLITGSIAVLVDILYLLVLNGNAKEEARRYANTRRQEDKVIDAFNEMVNAKEELANDKGAKTKSKENELMMEIEEREKRMEKSFVIWRKEYRKKRRAISNRNTVWASIPYLGKIVLYILLANMVINGIMGLDTLVLLIGYFEMTVTCMDKMTSYLLDLSNYGVRIERLKQIL